MKKNKLTKAETTGNERPLTDTQLDFVSGGVRARPVPLMVRWHCLDCGACGDWYSAQTEFSEMESAKTGHTNATGHLRFEYESEK